jgi:demethylmenaquinone methyltransferase/2-methoxy-6-polyprenyl-1,4-benzoquinol methylase
MQITPPISDVWNDSLLANPHAVSDKRERVRRMFAAIAPTYDLNNRLHTLWMDQSWRRRAVKLAKLKTTDRVVDVACGTGDLTRAFHRGGAASVVGIDFTFEMLSLAVGKSTGSRFISADAQALPLPDECCDVVSIAFGIRNVADPMAALREFHRVLRPGGRLIVLEFALPNHPLLRELYNFYFKQVLPRTATWISRDKTGAYKYLPRSVSTFFKPDQMAIMLRSASFSNVSAHPMTFGICYCYRGVK